MSIPSMFHLIIILMDENYLLKSAMNVNNLGNKHEQGEKIDKNFIFVIETNLLMSSL